MQKLHSNEDGVTVPESSTADTGSNDRCRRTEFLRYEVGNGHRVVLNRIEGQPGLSWDQDFEVVTGGQTISEFGGGFNWMLTIFVYESIKAFLDDERSDRRPLSSGT
jgi:hypothetical protein